MPPEKITELRVKHLEMLQGLITRMAGYGASFKSYCITVTTAVIGFAFTLHRPAVAALALLPVIAFGVVYNNARRDGVRHQSEVVQAVTHHVHHGEGPDQRKGNCNARDESCREVAEEDEK